MKAISIIFLKCSREMAQNPESTSTVSQISVTQAPKDLRLSSGL